MRNCIRKSLRHSRERQFGKSLVVKSLNLMLEEERELKSGYEHLKPVLDCGCFSTNVEPCCSPINMDDCPDCVEDESFFGRIASDIRNLFSDNEEVSEEEFALAPGFRYNKRDTDYVPMNGFSNRENPLENLGFC